MAVANRAALRVLCAICGEDIQVGDRFLLYPTDKSTLYKCVEKQLETEEEPKEESNGHLYHLTLHRVGPPSVSAPEITNAYCTSNTIFFVPVSISEFMLAKK